jgi:hypothetical protein
MPEHGTGGTILAVGFRVRPQSTRASSISNPESSEKYARTMTVDPSTHKIYLPAAKFDASTEGRRRGKMVPGNFTIQVYGTDEQKN